MKFVSIIALSAVALALAACDGDPQIKPTTIVEDNGASSAFYIAPNSPTLARWQNGRLSVTCPAGFHFRTRVVAAQGERAAYEEAVCEANETPELGEPEAEDVTTDPLPEG